MNEIEQVTMMLSTYNQMLKEKQILDGKYFEKQMDLAALNKIFDSLLEIYLKRISLIYSFEGKDKAELLNPDSNGFMLLRTDYALLLSIGVDKEKILSTLEKVIEDGR